MYFSSVNILVDNQSWILQHATILYNKLKELNLKVRLVRSHNDLDYADVTFLLGCTQIVSTENLSKSKYNLVVHESALPQGRGFAPMAWQIINGVNTIPISLIDATDKIDGGKIWLQKQMYLNGDELYDEWRSIQGEYTIALCLEFIVSYDTLVAQPQKGEASYYKRRTPEDSELDVNQSIAQQFDLLRTVDNENFPAFIDYRGSRYTILINKQK
ncbi:formyltransferase family protein [Alteromonas mediterranea]|uniref:Formyl transferase N-terminal domain-containing protein n=1 Tax=Alteromonas mediterranea (strain DSM 17117 / CIP 110805 / LMG 28347 / Deep ecotype) TaxID=1774373 RepID=F2G3X1_ALTMD|nr:formyltransferase family protein [Alteromonas mediterranea]AEA97313.1 hypothetical protein MADE_1005855 [Alteromonas mediterranea DE]CAH1198565.1 Bifunctional polymyxin resistance protein ArnA [Alteromonas mediterranea]